MIEILLKPIPNQSLSIPLGNQLYDIILKSTNGVMSASIARGNVVILSNVRLVAGTLIIPYRYLEDGNFFMETANGDLPDYTQFGITQRLYYITAAELGAIRAGT